MGMMNADTGNAVMGEYNASQAATRRVGAPLRKHIIDKLGCKTEKLDFTNSLIFNIYIVKYARGMGGENVCVCLHEFRT